MKNNIFISFFILTSTIIGLGIFVLPYTALKSGIYFYFWLITIPILIFIFHLIYGEIIFQLEEKHNLPSLVAKIINQKFKLPVWLIDFIGLTMVFLAYLLAIEQVLKNISPFDFLNFKLIIVSFILFVISFRNNFFGKIDSILSILLIIFFLGISSYLLPNIKIDYLFFAENDFWFSYGIILFSFTGYHSLQIIYDFLGKNKKSFIQVNLFSLIFIFFIYLFYVLSTLGFLGNNLQPLSIISLMSELNNIYFSYGIAILFLLSIITTFISLAFYLKRGLIVDFNIKEKLAWGLLAFLMIILSFLNLDNLIKILSFIGSLFIGINLILILICYLKLKNVYYFYFPKILVYFLILILGLGWLVGLLAE
ncbi:MAG: hypothetical protein NZ866_01620 [Patescibacteria group bacterium]|nr:hypothetical protein [Patescibacteria group bacterium]